MADEDPAHSVGVARALDETRAAPVAAFQSVLIFSSGESRGLVPALARRLKARYGSKVVLVCALREQVEQYRRLHGDAFDAYDDTNFFYASVLEEEPELAPLVARARVIEARYGEPLAQVLADDRHLAIAFSPGGTNYPRSRYAERATYARGLRAIVRGFEFFEELIARHGITLVVNGNKIASVICRGRGIPNLTLAAAKYRNNHYWATDEYYASALMPRSVAGLPDDGPDVVIDAPPQAYVLGIQGKLRGMRLGGMMKSVAFEAARVAYHRWRGYDKAASYVLPELLRHHWRIWADFRTLDRMPALGAGQLDTLDFIYFPLQHEPETSLTRFSHEFTDQQFAIRSIATVLPAGCFVAVKEHVPAIGLRPVGYYAQIARIPNVVFIHPFVPGIEVTRRARAVATITGTTGMEAATLGVPVISFGRHNIYNAIPHVTYVSDWLRIGAAVTTVLAADPAARAARQRDGQRFIKAVLRASTDFEDANFTKPVRTDLVDRAIDRMAATILHLAAEP